MSSEASDFESDSDNELQRAFQKGELKPGLHAVVPFVKKEHVNNAAGLKSKLENLRLNLDWLERLDCVNEPAAMTAEDEERFGNLEVKRNRKGMTVKEDDEDPVHNDFKREMLFYRQAQAAVLEGFQKLHKMRVATKRPTDYFAQMAKSDEHMKKIQEKLASKKESIERCEKAKKQRELKKFGKKTQHEVLQNRQKEKKQMLESVKKYKKGHQMSLDFLNENKGQKKGPQNKMKRQYKESKYGFGGQKKRNKYNTADSAADTSSFSRKKFNVAPGKKGKNNKRPGKSQRQNSRNRKRN